MFRKLAQSALKKLPRSVLYEVFFQSARALGVRSYQVSGAAGSFFGPLEDQSVTRVYLETGIWSDNIVGLIREFLSPEGGTFYDIGANIGLVSVPIAQDTRIKVVAFEPDIQNCSLLRANVAVSQLPVTIINAAVGAETGVLSFKRSQYNSGDHRLSRDGETQVQVVRLDDYPPPPGRFAVKIDTQGAEPLIFQGGERVLSQAGLIIAEFWPWGMRRMGLDALPVIDFAKRYFEQGFVLRHGEAIGAPTPIAETVARLESIVRAGGEYDAADLVLIRPR